MQLQEAWNETLDILIKNGAQLTEFIIEDIFTKFLNDEEFLKKCNAKPKDPIY